MLFAPNGLASGPQARFSAEEKGTKVKGGKEGRFIDKDEGVKYDAKKFANGEGQK
jgi:hypothetical protein